jgi:hypothetical protein
MFNQQLNFGLKIEHEGETFRTSQWAVKVKRPSEKSFYPLMPFMDLKEGDVFIAIDKDTGDRATHEDGSDVFKAISDPYRDELGIPCIDITTKLSKSELE